LGGNTEKAGWRDITYAADAAVDAGTPAVQTLYDGGDLVLGKSLATLADWGLPLWGLAGELWYPGAGGTWSCLADDCSNTKRVIAHEVTSPVADDQNIYWLRMSDDWSTYTLERTPRSARP
jgi:hypothetical protein